MRKISHTKSRIGPGRAVIVLSQHVGKLGRPFKLFDTPSKLFDGPSESLDGPSKSGCPSEH
jgi:hypothetical protein